MKFPNRKAERRAEKEAEHQRQYEEHMKEQRRNESLTIWERIEELKADQELKEILHKMNDLIEGSNK